MTVTRIKKKKSTTTTAETRTQAQRERVLIAAQICFIQDGFHAASMASISATADMSPGLIYRYFKSKNEIIIAIIERQLQLLRAEIAVLDGSIDLSARLTERYGNCGSGQTNGLSPALVLEMSAQATRDSDIAAAVAAFDTTVRADISDWLARASINSGHRLSSKSAESRALLLQCLIDGLKVRQTREPDINRKLLKSALDLIVPLLLTTDNTTSGPE
jgi:AcrR family transcriptional regulator